MDPAPLRQSMRSKLYRARRTGISREGAERIVAEGLRRAASKNGWRGSEPIMTMTLAHYTRLLTQIYGTQ